MKAVISKLKKSILCCQESKVEFVSRSFLKSFAGTFCDKCHYIKSERASGGLITCWSSKDFSCWRSYSTNTRERVVRALSSVRTIYGMTTFHFELFTTKFMTTL